MAALAKIALGIVFGLSIASAADFGGTWENDDDGEKTTLTLTQAGTKLTGTGKADGMALALEGTVDGSKAQGKITLKAEGLDIPLRFRAALSGDKLTFTISSDDSFDEAEEIVFVRKPAAAGTGGGAVAGAGPAAFSKEPSPILAEGQEYTHASGGKFRLPKGWRVEEAEGYLLLVPPDPAAGETILITAESAEGATDPSSPDVLAFLDGEIASAMPDAKRAGKPEPVVAGAGKGVALVWNGTLQGKKSQIKGYVTILEGKGVALLAVADEPQIQKRDPDLKAIFQSVGWGQGKVDRELVGTWHNWSYKGSSDYSFGRESKTKVELRADGTFSYEHNSEMQAGGGMHGTAGPHSIYARGGTGWGGRWTASGGTLILHFDDGTSEEFSYRFEQQGENVFLVTTTSDGKGKMEWSRG